MSRADIDHFVHEKKSGPAPTRARHRPGRRPAGRAALDVVRFRSPIKYAVQVGGGGLVGAEQIFTLEQIRWRGWQYQRFPELRINETGGPPDYLKHTAKDNINVCDFSRLVESQNQLLEIVLAIEENI